MFFFELKVSSKLFFEIQQRLKIYSLVTSRNRYRLIINLLEINFFSRTFFQILEKFSIFMVSDIKDKSCFQTILHLCVPVHRIHVVIVFIFFEFSFCVSISLAYNSFIISFDFNICPKIIKKKCSLFDWKQVSK